MSTRFLSSQFLLGAVIVIICPGRQKKKKPSYATDYPKSYSWCNINAIQLHTIKACKPIRSPNTTRTKHYRRRLEPRSPQKFQARTTVTYEHV